MRRQPVPGAGLSLSSAIRRMRAHRPRARSRPQSAKPCAPTCACLPGDRPRCPRQHDGREAAGQPAEGRAASGRAPRKSARSGSAARPLGGGGRRCYRAGPRECAARRGRGGLGSGYTPEPAVSTRGPSFGFDEPRPFGLCHDRGFAFEDRHESPEHQDSPPNSQGVQGGNLHSGGRQKHSSNSLSGWAFATCQSFSAAGIPKDRVGSTAPSHTR
jgi:hypothetical protein